METLNALEDILPPDGGWGVPSQLVFLQQIALPLPLLVGKGNRDLDLAELLNAFPQLGLQRPSLLAHCCGRTDLHPILLHCCLVAVSPLPCLLHLLQLLQGLGEVQGVGAGWTLLRGFWPWQ